MPTNCEDMSKSEINQRIAKLCGLKISIERTQMYIDLCAQFGEDYDGSIFVEGDGGFESVNYMENPSDAWPIILSTGMSIELAHKDLGDIGTCTIYNPMGTDWQCDFTDNGKALRAAMICFLKMKDSENANN